MKKFNKLIVVFLYSLPFIDLLTSIATWESKPSIGLVIKGTFLVLAGLSVLYKNRKKKSYWVIYGLFVFYLLIHGVYYKEFLKVELVNLIKIFYLPFLILFFSQCENRSLSKKLYFYYAMCFLLMYLLPYPLGLGHNINEIYENKDLYLSYFYVGNELVNIFILVIPIGFLYLKDKPKGYLLGYLFLSFLMMVLLGTKTMYCSFILILFYYLFKERQKAFGFLKKYVVFVLSFLLLMIVFVPQTPLYKNIKTSIEYYNVKRVSELFTFQNIDNIIYSNRLTFISNLHKSYQKENIFGKILGMGRHKIISMKDAEIDIFDIFYSIGILGTFVYLIIFIFAVYKSRLIGIYAYLFFLLLVISFFSGHVLISPMTSSYLAILTGVYYNERKNDYERLDKKSTKTS